jgi:hypothetical protein
MGYHAFADLPSSFATREKIYYNPPTMTSFRVCEGAKYPTSADLVESLSFDQSSMQELPHHESILNGEDEGPSFRLTVVDDTVGATVTTATPSESKYEVRVDGGKSSMGEVTTSGNFSERNSIHYRGR